MPELEEQNTESFAFRDRFVASLDYIEDALKQTVEAPSSDGKLAELTPAYISACNALLKVAETRHSVFSKHNEAIEVAKLQSSIDDIGAHLEGHATASGMGEDPDDTGGEGDHLQ